MTVGLDICIRLEAFFEKNNRQAIIVPRKRIIHVILVCAQNNNDIYGQHKLHACMHVFYFA